MLFKDLLEDDYIGMTDILDSLCVKGPVSNNLKDNLMQYTKDRLIGMSEYNEMAIKKSLNKKAFVEEMAKHYKRQDLLSIVYSNLTDQELFLVEELIKSDQAIHGHFKYRIISYLASYGFIQMSKAQGTYAVIMSDDVKTMFQAVQSEALESLRKLQQEITTYTKAAINFYGCIHKEQLMAIYVKHMEEIDSFIVNEEHLEILFENQMMKFQSFYYDGEHFMSDFFDGHEDAAYDILLNGKPYYVPEYKEFIKYSDESYIEKNAMYLDLEKFVYEKFTRDEDKAEDFLFDVVYEAEYGRIQDVFNLIEEYGFILTSEKDLDTFMKAYMNYSNNKRIWVNHGYTPNELFNLERKVKVGRNEPCPCGSGKKYKKCCGN